MLINFYNVSEYFDVIKYVSLIILSIHFACSHSATLLNDQLVIFGGWDAPVCFNDLHILDLGNPHNFQISSP